MEKPDSGAFYGVATVGAKGQIVIPAEAREDMSMHPGDKVIVIGKRNAARGFNMVCICPLESAEQFVTELTNQISRTKAAIDQAKNMKEESNTL